MRMMIFAVLLVCAGCSKAPSENESSDDLDRILADYPIVSETTWRDVDVMVCEPAIHQVCGAKGCEIIKKMKDPTWIRWHPKTQEYERCDSKGCDSYKGQISYGGGSWANIALPENGVMMRLAGKNQFFEVATRMDAIYIKRGQCRVER